MPCESGKIWNTSAWLLPSDVMSNAMCIDPTAEVITNSLPGDKWKTVADCFSTKSTTVTWVNSTCTTATKIGDSCYDEDSTSSLDQICPIGSFWKVDDADQWLNYWINLTNILNNLPEIQQTQSE